MSEQTCEIDGKIFVAVPHNKAADDLCQGCAGDEIPEVCRRLGNCIPNRIIWVEVE